MSQATAKKLMTVEEYLAFEEKSKIRHEYMDGEIFAMAGGTRFHSLIMTNISRYLGNQLEDKPCEVHVADLRVKVKKAHYVYPDVVVACNAKFIPDIFDTLENPQIVFEVTSKSTAYRDRYEKRMDYLDVDSLTDYLLVSQKEIRVEHYRRISQKEWKVRIYEEPEQALKLDSIGCELTLAQIYRKVEFSTKLKLVKSKKK